jgi:quaternary ammonium compound-resistance protein SugE
MPIAWVYLLIAGLAEIAWAIGLKLTNGWSRFWPSVYTIVLIVISYVFLSLALKSLPLGTAYAVWTGIGAVGAALAGMVMFGESREPLRLFWIALIVIGALGLKASVVNQP